jgi:hypothetical protein
MPYLAGTILIGAVWAVLYYIRPDVRKDMLWSSWYFLFIITLGFVAMKFTMHVSAAESINPGYWSPQSLFDLNAQTGGYSIEDAFFMFFIGGIAAVLFEEVFRRHVRYRRITQKPHHAVLFGVVCAAIVAFTHVNLIYALITFCYAGALYIWIVRRDLFVHSLLGGTSFLLVYIGGYVFTMLFFPDFVTHRYHLENISGKLFIGVPLEEYMFALGLGFMWSPIYEYAKNLREVTPARGRGGRG